MAITKWMSWEGGVDLVALTQPGLAMPNILVHVARIVHTPIGSAPAGMVLIQPDPNAAPLAIGFISTNPEIGKYFGPNIFAGTPFEKAPVLQGSIDILENLPSSIGARISIPSVNLVIETLIADLGPLVLVNRPPAAMPPFTQQGLEAEGKKASLKLNGKEIAIQVPPVGISGGPAAVWSPTGVYSR